MKEYDYIIDLDVRDYELDMQGIVNNAVYQNYLEHCRHSYLMALGIDFARLNARDIQPVVVRAEIDYLQPLISGDHFDVGLKISHEGRLRYIFHQEIIRRGSIICKAKITVAILNNGIPIPLPEFRQAIEDFRSERKKEKR